MSKNKTSRQVLIVDDEPLILDLLRCSLSHQGYNVSKANNGLEALQAIAEQDFDVILMDIRMPVMDGLTATNFLRKCEQGDHLSLTEHPELAQSIHAARKGMRLPVVAVTGNLADKELVYQAGMDKYLPKPFNFSKLCDIVEHLCSNSPDSLPSQRKRSHRHVVKDGSIIVSHGTSGEIINISTSGIAIQYPHHKAIPQEWNATFCNRTKKISTPSLPLRLVRQEGRSVSPSGTKTQIIGAMFNKPDPSQQQHIRHFIRQLQ